MKQIKIKTTLTSDTIHLSNIDKWIGKEVEIIIRELLKTKIVSKKWKSFGKLKLKGSLDKVNIRNIAYE